MEEWEYLEGHKELYKDVVMARQPTLTSPDGSSNGNPPERCPRPLYSHRDPTQEDLAIPHHHQSGNLENDNIIKDENKVEDEKYGVMKELPEGHKDPYKNINQEPPNNPPERCPRPLYSHQDSTQEELAISHHHQDEELRDVKPEVKKEEEEKMYLGGYEQSTAERNSLYCQDTTQEEQNILQNDQGEEVRYVKVEVKEEQEEMMVSGDQLSMEKREISKQEESSLLIDTSGHYAQGRNTSEGCLIISPGNNDITRSSLSNSPLTSHSVERSTATLNPEQSSLCHEGGHSGDGSFSGSELGKHSTQEGVRKSSTGKPLHSCSVCGKCFIVKSRLLRHETIHTDERPYSCLECGKCFKLKKHLDKHEKTHTGERPFSCSECGKCFTAKGTLQLHQKCHTGERPCSCSVCGKCFRHKAALLRHQKVHTGERPFSCSECGKGFSDKAHLVKHHRIHTGERPFSCSECGKCFTEKGTLRLHQSCHTGERPHLCSECGKGFSRKSGLLLHQKIHKRPFPCSECGTCFILEADLVKHQKIHTGERPYSCSECGKSFAQKGGLVLHQRIHTGERPFSCPVCDKRFNDKRNLHKHERSHQK